MTEQEWMKTVDPREMLQAIRHSKVSERKTRLLNVALCHLFWGCLADASKAIVSESECLADGLVMVTPDELCRRANEAVPPYDLDFGSSIEREAAKAVCYAVLPREIFAAVRICQTIDPTDERPQSVIRDIFGTPFRPQPTIDPGILHWNDSTIPTIAQAIYDNRRFTDMPILADALEESGCSCQEILAHCRRTGDHVRGCWLVDALLGKL